MSTFRNPSKLIMMALIALLMITGAGCKSKKKAMEAAAAEKARQEQLAAAEKDRLAAEEAKRKEAEEKARRDSEAKAVEPKQKLDLFFNAIANSSSASAANNSIAEAMSLFASPDTPVLIVISEENGQKDYDRPTTIKDYLNYLKDQKKSANKVSNLQFDGSGKITEVELVKQK